MAPRNTTSRDCCQHYTMIFLKGAVADGCSYQFTTEGDIGCQQLAVRVQLAHTIDVMVCAHQLVAHRHLDNLIYLTGIHQTVTAHNGLVLRSRGHEIVEVIMLDQAAAIDAEQACLAQRLTDMRIRRTGLPRPASHRYADCPTGPAAQRYSRRSTRRHSQEPCGRAADGAWQ